MNPVEDFLRAQAELLRLHLKNDPGPQFGGYSGMADFVVKNGQEFSTDNPLDIKRGPMRECFRNAALLALSRKGYIYCEGYALGIIPVMHAWVTKDGRIGETTWSEIGSAYFGIPFKGEYLRKALCSSGHYGVLDRWKEGWPTQHEPKELWHHAPVNV